MHEKWAHDHRMVSEGQLGVGLQPIRHFVLAQALYTVLDLGVWTIIAESDEPVPLAVIANRLELDVDRLHGLLTYLENEDYVRLDAELSVRPTERSRSLDMLKPWYDLIVGGYSETFANLATTLRTGADYGRRNGRKVGEGSCGISQHDALPMTRSLLNKIDGRCQTIVDIGCGDGSYLIDLCESLEDVKGLGFDPDPASIDTARRIATSRGLGEMLTFEVGNATMLPDLSDGNGSICFLTAFVLQELLEQAGREAVLSLLRSSFAQFPEAYWVVVEVDHQPNARKMVENPLGLAYYNPYYLIHHITEQRLAPVPFWLELFEEAGLQVVATEYPDPAYDSLQLKIAFLLHARDDHGQRQCD